MKHAIIYVAKDILIKIARFETNNFYVFLNTSQNEIFHVVVPLYDDKNIFKKRNLISRLRCKPRVLTITIKIAVVVVRRNVRRGWWGGVKCVRV